MYVCVQMAGMSGRSEWEESDYRIYCFSIGVCVCVAYIFYDSYIISMWVFQQEKSVSDYKTHYYTLEYNCCFYVLCFVPVTLNKEESVSDRLD